MTVSAHGVLYIAACVLLPIAWGLVVVWASNWLEPMLMRHRPPAERTNGDADDEGHRPMEPPPLEYHI